MGGHEKTGKSKDMHIVNLKFYGDSTTYQINHTFDINIIKQLKYHRNLDLI